MTYYCQRTICSAHNCDGYGHFLYVYLEEKKQCQGVN